MNSFLEAVKDGLGLKVNAMHWKNPNEGVLRYVTLKKFEIFMFCIVTKGDQHSILIYTPKLGVVPRVRCRIQ